MNNNLPQCSREICRICILVSISILVIISFTSIIANAAALRGNISSDFYGLSDGENDHIRPYLSTRLNLTAWKTKQRMLSFHTYMRWMTDLQDKMSSDPQMFVYDSYLKFRCKPRRMTIFAGRQFVYSASGSALIDGARIKVEPSKKIEIDFFGGSRVSRIDPERVESFSDFGVYGAQANYRFNPDTRFGLSWMIRKNEGFVSYHRIGMNISQYIGQARLYGRLSFHPEKREASEILVRARHTVKDWYISGEYLWRDPSVSFNSIFSLIDYRRYREVRFEIRRTVRPGLAVFGSVRGDFFPVENSWTSKIGIRTGNISAAWVHQNGYAGDIDGLSGNMYFQYRKSWQFFARVNVSKYRIQEQQDDRSEAYATGVGLMRRFGHDFQVRIEWQYLRNAVQKYDSRFHLRISKGFEFK